MIASNGDSSDIGVCYGMNGDNLPHPSKVVGLYQSNQIGRMRLYEPNHSVFRHLRGSGIHVIVGVRNDDIKQLAISYDAAKQWVYKNILPYANNVIFRYIVVGNDVIPGKYAEFVLPAMKNLHNALSIGGLWHKIKVSTAVSTSVMGQSYPPSAGTFSNRTLTYMEPIAKYLYSIGAPLLANVYPYFSYLENPKHIWLPYALFLEKSDVVQDSGFGYRNLFDASVDALYASLEKVGAPHVTIVVAETGWPSAGNDDVSRDWIAWLYNSNVVKHVLSSQGTPRRPGVPIETYLFAMFDEDENLGGVVISTQHFGLYKPNMTPSYPIDFIKVA
ncbi:Glycoside hydrolase [Macleaya cordata]|uniref:Glycoside hydrolase n=1 Tax=Macleaya cordata TaxID=56857 RepID=A0A200RAB9_MACCD|nr:Glycoside hydrolase [Macleaya cordata]